MITQLMLQRCHCQKPTLAKSNETSQDALECGVYARGVSGLKFPCSRKNRPDSSDGEDVTEAQLALPGPPRQQASLCKCVCKRAGHNRTGTERISYKQTRQQQRETLEITML